MASFNGLQKLEIDDTVPLTCTILATDNSSGHVDYIMKVQRGFDQKYSWQINRRYNEFNDLYAQIKVANYELSLPPKKAFGNMKPEFLNTRQIGLQKFIDKVLANLLLANSLSVKRFLDKDNYFENYQELALQHVSMYFRSEPNWEVIQPLSQIGWRFRKQHVLLKNTEIPDVKYILTWFEHSVDKILKENELKTIFQQFCLIKHENIEPMVRINSGENSTIMIQKYNDKLISLKDYIYGQTKITSYYMKKYAKQNSPPTISVSMIKVICKKILLALYFIYSQGLFYGQTHTGNVLIEQNGNSLKLTDLPNSFLGLSYFYRPYVIDQKKIHNLELVDVYGLGHILYELTYGEPLLTSSCRTNFSDCDNHEIKQMLEILLGENGLKSGLPTLSELLEMSFFKNTTIETVSTSLISTGSPGSNMNKLFLSGKVAELITKSREFIERRINEEQKAMNKLKRQTQAEAKLLSEEEIKKRRKEKKKAAHNLNNSLEYPTSLSQGSNKVVSNTNKTNETKKTQHPSSPFIVEECFKSESIQNIAKISQSPLPGLPPPPPPGLPPPPPPGLPQFSVTNTPKNTTERTNLLDSISSFSKNCLKKVTTDDRSAIK